jgi:hypothetical protein
MGRLMNVYEIVHFPDNLYVIAKFGGGLQNIAGKRPNT